MTPGRPGPEKAAWHYARALSYRQDAQLLLERDRNPYSAGALLYESAKQCINAVANQRGVNPVSTLAKAEFLSGLAEQEPGLPNLLTHWRAATRLHSHTDQGHLNAADSRDSRLWPKPLLRRCCCFMPAVLNRQFPKTFP